MASRNSEKKERFQEPFEPAVSTICQKCEEMINTPDDEWHLHHDTYAAVQDAASRIGCPICVELVKRIDEFTPSSSSDNRTCIKYGFIKVDPDYRIVDLKVDESDNYPSSTDFRWHLIRVSGIEYDKHLASLHHVCLNTPPSSTGDPDVAALARSWLDECQREHTTCYNGSPDYYPPRLLDLNESVPRLVTTEPLIEQRRINGPYATLSHCWGPNPQFLTLTQDNIHQLQQEIPIPNLPATFGDAISFCRQLNLQYLWIDSLCIIQSGDNSQDQSLHLPKIPAIYRNALLNISAAHVASPTEPLFSARNPQAIKPILLKNEYLLISDSFLEDEPFHSPLHRRAWVLQERLLSPRVVHFGRNQVFWECSEWNKDAMRSETFQGGLPRKLGLDKEFDLPDFQSTEKEDADEAMSVLVSEYSDCKLTYPDHDKLVAFAGIAEHFSRVCGDEYVAGLFLREFPDALVWIVLIPPKSRPEYRIYRCPSWSWGNVDAQIVTSPRSYSFIGSMKNGLKDRKTLAGVVDIRTDLLDETNPFGRLRNAEIVLRGPLEHIRWEESSVNCSGDDQVWFSFRASHLPGPVVVESGVDAYFDSEEDSHFDMDSSTAAFLPIVQCGHDTVVGLILNMVERGDVERYERVGILKLSIENLPEWLEAAGEKDVVVI